MDTRERLNAIGMTSTELARALGVSDGHIADIRSGRRALTIEMAAKIEAISGVTGLVEGVAAERRVIIALQAATQ